MFINVPYRKLLPLSLNVLLCVLLGLVGCEYDDSEPDPVEICIETNLYYCPATAYNDPFGIALTLAWYSGQCSKEVLCENDQRLNDVNVEEGIIDDNFIEQNWHVSQIEDIEPNNTFEQAAAFVLSKQNGVLVYGTLDSESDLVDRVAFILDGSPDITIYLCRTPDECQQPWYQGDDMYLELHDANLNLMSSSYELTLHGHAFTNPFLGSGQVYYLSVVASENMQGITKYKLVITD